MKRFLLQIITRNPKNPIIADSVQFVEGEDLVELLSKLPLLIIEVQSKIIERNMNNVIDDDIPF